MNTSVLSHVFTSRKETYLSTDRSHRISNKPTQEQASWSSEEPLLHLPNAFLEILYASLTLMLSS